jgi:hypothetical protein
VRNGNRVSLAESKKGDSMVAQRNCVLNLVHMFVLRCSTGGRDELQNCERRLFALVVSRS